MSSLEDSSRHGQTQTTAATALVRMAEIEGRGRALIASKALRAGKMVLRDFPILLYSAVPLKPSPSASHQRHFYCSNCFRILEPFSSPSVVSCPSCTPPVVGGEREREQAHALVLFCSPNCRSAALASSHTPWVCQALSRLRDYCPSSLPLHHHQERQLQARFLVAAYNLAIVSPSNFRILLCLQGESPAQPDDDAALFLHSLIFSLCPPPPHSSADFSFSLELTAALLAKDKLNAFGLMEPLAKDGDGERSVRAYGIYPNASFFNHDCLPNACRFDYVDAAASAAATATAAAGCNTDVVVRMLHDVPEGREICLSYFPVNLNYSDRQRRLREDYGFTCTCDRCKVEANWSDEEEEEEENDVEGYNEEEEEEEEAMDEDRDELMEDSTEDGGVKEENNFPHAYFFLRYMCNRKNCWGTLAPLPPSNGTPSRVMECNVCGNVKNDEDALEE